MNLDSVRELKQVLSRSVIASLRTTVRTRAFGAQARALAPAFMPPTLALGIAPVKKRDFRLAVRIQQRVLEGSNVVEVIRREARNEVDIRYVGRVVKRVARQVVPWYHKRNRPLRSGGSLGHEKITAGTLGCFARSRGANTTMVLSNNHVLANENHGRRGDAILQPGRHDGGRIPDDVVGTLNTFVRLQKNSINHVDCGSATLIETIDFDPRKLTGLGRLRGPGPEFLDQGTEVAKVGRTTGVTHGLVTAFEIDGLVVEFDIGDLTFDNQIEIEGAGRKAFSDGGDSGSLIVDNDYSAVALLFAGSDLGGSNQRGLTFANPIHTVLQRLSVDLLV